MVPIWILILAVAALAVAFAVVPRLRKRPPHASGPAPKGSSEEGRDGLTRSTAPPDEHPGKPTMGRNPDGPPAP